MTVHLTEDRREEGRGGETEGGRLRKSVKTVMVSRHIKYLQTPSLHLG